MRPGNCSGSYSAPPRASAIAWRSSSPPRDVDATTFSILIFAMLRFLPPEGACGPRRFSPAFRGLFKYSSGRERPSGPPGSAPLDAPDERIDPLIIGKRQPPSPGRAEEGPRDRLDLRRASPLDVLEHARPVLRRPGRHLRGLGGGPVRVEVDPRGPGGGRAFAREPVQQ